MVTCGGAVECEDCVDSCQLSPETYAYGNKLFNLGDDPREEHDLFDQYPEVKRLLIFYFFIPTLLALYSKISMVARGHQNWARSTSEKYPRSKWYTQAPFDTTLGPEGSRGLASCWR